jgi:3-hydroxy acid dehydrogenase / malonic semialdehyde reductase
MDLNGKIVLITGASAGIGRACAEIFAKAGANLILLARRENKLNELGLELKQKFGIDYYIIPCDIRNYKELETAFNSLPPDWKKIDILINNAGLARGLEKIHEGTIENWEIMIDTNLKGLLYVSRLVLPGMVERNDGIVINIGSTAGREVYPSGNVYCATKFAVKALSKSMSIDLNGTNIRICNLDPGHVDTEFVPVRFDGNQDMKNTIYKGFTPLQAKDIAEVAFFVATRPANVCIQDILVVPTAQATTTIISRKTE